MEKYKQVLKWQEVRWKIKTSLKKKSEPHIWERGTEEKRQDNPKVVQVWN